MIPPDDDALFARQHARFTAAWREAEQTRRRAGWWKRWAVCWWRHRTRRLAAGVYVSRACWACTDPK